MYNYRAGQVGFTNGGPVRQNKEQASIEVEIVYSVNYLRIGETTLSKLGN